MKFSFFTLVLFWFGLAHTVVAQKEVTLEEVVSVAIQKNFDVRLFQNTAAIATTNNELAFGAFLPLINGTAAYTTTNNDSRNVTFADVETIRTGAVTTNQNASAQLVWTLFDGTRMFATKNRITQLAELGEINVRNQMMNSVASVSTNYFNIVRQKQQLKAIVELTSVNEERVKLAERKLAVGSGSKPELLQAKVDLNAQRVAALLQETLIQQLKDQLNNLVGMALPEVYEISDTIPLNTGLTMESIIQDIENSNQTIIAAKKNIDIATTAVWENKATRSPTLNFNAAYNYFKTENKLQINPATQQFSQTNGLVYGFSLAVPIMNGFNVKRNIAQAQITLERQKLLLEQLKAIALVGVKNSFASYDNAKKTLTIQEENLILAKENVKIALEGFKRGVNTYIELRTAQQSLADVYNQLIAARYNTKVAEIELFRLKGGLLK
jgi:outer membrane protein TolC